MTAPLSADRIKELREWLTSLTSGSDDDIRADLLSILDDYSSLRAENELLNNNAMNDYAAHLELKARAEKAEAELDEEKGRSASLGREIDRLHAALALREGKK